VFLGLLLCSSSCSGPETSAPPAAAPPLSADECKTSDCFLAVYARKLRRVGRLPGAWKTNESESFRIFHFGYPEVEEVASTAEKERAAQIVKWGGLASAAPWNPRCSVYLFPTQQQLIASTGVRLAGQSHAVAAQLRKAVLAREIKVSVDDPHLLTRVLPHEIAHILLRELVRRRSTPLWAEEGIAGLAEGKEWREQRLAAFRSAFSTGNLFAVKALMTATLYPTSSSLTEIFYAQSNALVRYFLAKGTRPMLLGLIEVAGAGPIEDALRRIYGLNGFAELEEEFTVFGSTL
jgi:hypothetical protein